MPLIGRLSDLSPTITSPPTFFCVMSLAAEGKRSRTPETSDSAAEFAKKKKTPCRGEVWFDDGNLIITTGDTMFKLYKGLLAAQSPVFAGMFAVADSNSGPLSGDTSQVELHDSPEDMTHLLRALLPRMNVYDFMYAAPPAAVLTQILAANKRIAGRRPTRSRNSLLSSASRTSMKLTTSRTRLSQS